MYQKSRAQGFTLIEAVIGGALFLILALAVYQVYVSIFAVIAANQDQTLAVELANEQFEIVRNMSYSNVGIPSGIPTGVIPEVQNITRGNIPFTVTTIVRNTAISLGSVSASTTASTSPSEKLVAVTVSCDSCKNFKTLTLTGQIAPKNLIVDTVDGALSIKAFNANGIPIVGASVTVTNTSTTPAITVVDTTNNDGLLQIVGVPPSSSSYHIVVTKAGYSTDKTYPSGASGNPTPTKPDATVLSQKVTSASFSIDQLSSLSVSSVTNGCTLVPNVGFTLAGSKTIGPNVPKYSATTTTGGTGKMTLNNMEWDAYSFGLNSASYDLAGLNILNPVQLNPGSNQQVLLVVAPKNPDSLLVTVEDSSTNLPLTGATVTLAKSGFSSTLTTGQGFIDQTDWSGVAGHDAYTTNEYFSDDGHVSKNTPVGDINLLPFAGIYPSSGLLQSSTFDAGTTSNFVNLVWQPGSQPLASGTTSVKLQLATSPSSTPSSWNFVGPDGTGATYYTSANSSIGSMHNGDRYLRYQALLSTASATNTPDLSDVAFTFSTACTPPGQVLFQGLTPGTYTLTTSASGYTTNSVPVTINSPWSSQTVVVSP